MLKVWQILLFASLDSWFTNKTIGILLVFWGKIGIDQTPRTGRAMGSWWGESRKGGATDLNIGDKELRSEEGVVFRFTLMFIHLSIHYKTYFNKVFRIKINKDQIKFKFITLRMISWRSKSRWNFFQITIPSGNLISSIPS